MIYRTFAISSTCSILLLWSFFQCQKETFHILSLSFIYFISRDPEQKSVEQARAERLEREKEHFNEEHYIDDYLDTEGEIAGKLEKDHLDFSKARTSNMIDN